METQVVSSFFTNNSNENSSESISDQFLDLADELNMLLKGFKPSNVDCIYNPTIYARHTFEMYVRNYCNTRKKVMFFGMNPGPFGMSQTGVPFGEISSVRDWLKIEGPVGKPPKEISSRPIIGFECTRSEVSGKRFWGLFRDLCGTPEKFFETSFVYNYLPQQWLTKNGSNVTPGDCKADSIQPLYSICDRIFSKVLELYEVENIVAIGKFCETRAHKSLDKYPSSRNIQIIYMKHPSSRIPNNNDWPDKAIECLKKNNLYQLYSQT